MRTCRETNRPCGQRQSGLELLIFDDVNIFTHNEACGKDNVSKATGGRP